MIWLKIIFAIILSAMPFLLHYHIRHSEVPAATINHKQNSPLFSAVSNFFSQIRKFLRFLYQGMKKYDSFRKFFTLIVFLFMIVIQFIDFQVATSSAAEVQAARTNGIQNAGIFFAFEPFLTAPAATLLAATLALVFFSYRITNIVLLKLHSNKKIFCSVALIAMFIILYSFNWFILGETIFVILLASYVFPSMNKEEKTKGRKPIPLPVERFSKAA